jgi:DNA-directed RNA polymerase subunit RPC12/RpoP
MQQDDGEEESSERNAHVCSDCGAESPEVETNYTLISARHGWRLTRAFLPDGKIRMEWRCPTCWVRFKSTKTP